MHDRRRLLHLKKKKKEEAIKLLCLMSVTYVICIDTAVVAVLSYRATDLSKSYRLVGAQFSQLSN